MRVFKGNNVPGLYADILREILLEGKEVGPRGLKTKELSPVCIEVTDPRRRLFGHPHRKDVSIFTYIEGLWILRHENKPDRLVHYVPAMANFVNEETGELDGAYGPAISTQLDQCFQRLKADPDTRQAVVMINQPQLHRLPTKDFPCTLTFQFLLRDDFLDLIVNMRSQDAWLGLIYDTGEFQWFQEIMAGWLGVNLGRYYHIDGSLHLYERDWKKAQEVVDYDFNFALYDQAVVLDARLGKFDYDQIERHMAFWEYACRKGDFNSVEEWEIHNDFYMNLADIIMAYNLRLEGHKEEAYEIVRHNKSDLGLIYETRWRRNAE
jgi:thymidylate synthase